MSLNTFLGLFGSLLILAMLGWIRQWLFLAGLVALILFAVVSPASAQSDPEPTTTTTTEPTTTTTTEASTVSPLNCTSAGVSFFGLGDLSMAGLTPEQEAEMFGAIMVPGDRGGASLNCAMMFGFGLTYAGMTQIRDADAAHHAETLARLDALTVAVESLPSSGPPPTSSLDPATSGLDSGGIDWTALTRGFVGLIFVVGAVALGHRWLSSAPDLASGPEPESQL